MLGRALRAAAEWNAVKVRDGLKVWSRNFAVAAPDYDTAERVLSPALIRNLAVIAHVDHGKTTLMDRLLKQCGAIVARDRTLDSISLERERGITIASKYTSMHWGENTLNVVDTPGHADFGGEVERVIGMVDGAVLVVDAGEGPLAQTKFVVAKALKAGIRPILLMNKVDRPAVTEERCGEVESMVFDLFANLGATEEQLEFPVLYASAKEGWASSTYTKKPDGEPSMAPLIDTIVKHVPPPKADLRAPFQLVVSMMEHDPFFGRILTGRIHSGTVKIGDKVHGIRRKEDTGASETFDEGKIVKILKKKGVSSEPTDSAGAGDIVSISGLSQPFIGNTVAAAEVKEALPSVKVDPPTISMTFSVNDSPLAGKDGKHLTGPKIGERLKAEEECNISIKVIRSTVNDAYEVQGRGELQLGILIENMRREGFELSVSPPAVLYKTENGKKLEPIEEVRIEVDDEHAGLVIETLTHRRAELLDMGPCAESAGRTRLSFTCPSRGLVGYRSAFNTLAHGSGFLHRAFLGYEEYKGPVGHVRKGVLVATSLGTITSYAIMGLEARGSMFVQPGMETYEGMIVGEHCRDSDLDVNPVKSKELTNIRAPGKDENVRLTPPRLMSLEEAIGYVGPDELIEVTPKAIRLRKRYLDSTKRKAHARKMM